ncbi:DUF3325 family protein [Niabella beijingensis]|uniref:DUF3325 family protein n=1 Tax=Niabella beijingensis TaxID=2872700 RepID=UPI001CBE85F4|nr:DUF3325 family protein [Niabella beijingensis]MBZ4191882.1 DUF3325 family protein [Niabella beijingensis]
MYTLIIICCFAGFYQQYDTSRKAKLTSGGSYEKWIRLHPLQARWSGAALLLAGLILLIIKDGAGVGVFTFVLLLMAAACYTVALVPLNALKPKHIVLLIILSFLLELFLFR